MTGRARGRHDRRVPARRCRAPRFHASSAPARPRCGWRGWPGTMGAHRSPVNVAREGLPCVSGSRSPGPRGCTRPSPRFESRDIRHSGPAALQARWAGRPASWRLAGSPCRCRTRRSPSVPRSPLASRRRSCSASRLAHWATVSTGGRCSWRSTSLGPHACWDLLRLLWPGASVSRRSSSPACCSGWSTRFVEQQPNRMPTIWRATKAQPTRSPSRTSVPSSSEPPAARSAASFWTASARLPPFRWRLPDLPWRLRCWLVRVAIGWRGAEALDLCLEGKGR